MPAHDFGHSHIHCAKASCSVTFPLVKETRNNPCIDDVALQY